MKDDELFPPEEEEVEEEMDVDADGANDVATTILKMIQQTQQITQTLVVAMQILRDILSLTGVREHIGRMREALEDDRAALDGVGDAPERDKHVERFVGEGIRVRDWQAVDWC